LNWMNDIPTPNPFLTSWKKVLQLSIQLNPTKRIKNIKSVMNTIMMDYSTY
jgi:hypothetical protein